MCTVQESSEESHLGFQRMEQVPEALIPNFRLCNELLADINNMCPFITRSGYTNEMVGCKIQQVEE